MMRQNENLNKIVNLNQPRVKNSPFGYISEQIEILKPAYMNT